MVVSVGDQVRFAWTNTRASDAEKWKEDWLSDRKSVEEEDEFFDPAIREEDDEAFTLSELSGLPHPSPSST